MWLLSLRIVLAGCFIALQLQPDSAKAQAKKPAVNQSPLPTGLRIRMGSLPGGLTTIDLLKASIDSPIVVYDAKGVRYPVKDFRVNYFFKSSYRDEESQQTKTVRDFRARDFYNSDRLSADWSASIRDNVKSGDSMLINNIVVRLKNGKSFPAPEWRVIVR